MASKPDQLDYLHSAWARFTVLVNLSMPLWAGRMALLRGKLHK